MSFDERQPDANYRQMCVNLTAERDALREIVDHMTKHGVPPEHSYEVLRADNERLRANVEATRSALAAWVDRDAAKTVQLTELREAAEQLGRAARQTILTDLTGYTERELESAIATVERLLGLRFVSLHEPSIDLDRLMPK